VGRTGCRRTRSAVGARKMPRKNKEPKRKEEPKKKVLVCTVFQRKSGKGKIRTYTQTHTKLYVCMYVRMYVCVYVCVVCVYSIYIYVYAGEEVW